MRRSWFPSVSETWWPHWAISEKVAGIVYCVHRGNASQTISTFDLFSVSANGRGVELICRLHHWLQPCCSRQEWQVLSDGVTLDEYCVIWSCHSTVLKTWLRVGSVLGVFAEIASSVAALMTCLSVRFYVVLMKMNCCEILRLCHLHRLWFPSVSATWWPCWAIRANVVILASKCGVQRISNSIFRMLCHVGVVD